MLQGLLQNKCPLFHLIRPYRPRQMMVVWQERLNLPYSVLSHFVAAWQMTAERQSDRMAPDTEVFMKQGAVIEFLHVEKIIPTGVHQYLLNFHGDQTVDASTVRQWMVCFSGNDDISGSPPLVQIFTSVAHRHLFITGENA